MDFFLSLQFKIQMFEKISEDFYLIDWLGCFFFPFLIHTASEGTIILILGVMKIFLEVSMQ